MLKSEDRNNRYMRTCGDCLEYFLREEIFVILCAYVQTNTPPGFTKYGLRVLATLLKNVRSVTLLCQKSVSTSLTQLLQFLYKYLHETGADYEGWDAILKLLAAILG